MLSSVGENGEALRAAELGVAMSLTKPVRQSALRDAILDAISRAPAVAPAKPEPPARDETPSPVAAPRPASVLLADDNPVNTRLIVKTLEKHGHRVHCVSNGRDAVTSVTEQTFDLVLMDVQMPEMDGLDATRAIRHGEIGTSRRLPIVALTAHAMKGDREVCLAAGMDAYLTKPVRAEALLDVIERLTGSRSTSPPVPVALPEKTPLAAQPALDAVEALARVAGDRELLGELVDLFRTESTRVIEEMRRAIEVGDSKTLERSAHKLRGSVASFSARGATQLALSLEIMGRDTSLPSGDASRALAALEAELGRLGIELAQLRLGEPA
jgi:CheY-like chemotaxis protein/HPt (histidine-containing phosphotransfer) domain-containing protein